MTITGTSEKAAGRVSDSLESQSKSTAKLTAPATIDIKSVKLEAGASC